jgi:glycosyltransferase involved in cell wall biosynthesis
MDYFPNVDAVQFFGREVLPLVRQQIPNLRFVIAGRKPTPEVACLAAEDSSIVVTGDVPDMRPYLRGAAVAVAPMRIARGVQNKILEALAMDVPVVASPMATAALPKELASLVVVDGEPVHIAARVKEHVLTPPRIGARRAFLKRFIEVLNLPAQLEQLVNAAAAPATRGRTDQFQVVVKSSWKAAL